jgi:hypothetical protein
MTFEKTIQRHTQRFIEGKFVSTFYGNLGTEVMSDIITSNTSRRVTHEPHHGLFGMGFDLKHELIVIAAGLMLSKTTVEQYRNFEGTKDTQALELLEIGINRVTNALCSSKKWSKQESEIAKGVLLQCCPLAINIIHELEIKLPKLPQQLEKLAI